MSETPSTIGSFYTNIALRTGDIDTVASVLGQMKRSAYVGTDGKTVVVFDEKCDEQDLDEIQRLAAQLSARLECAALAVCNHDDDVFWYGLASDGTIVDTYDSFPGYFDGGSEEPSGGDAEKLCAAFGVTDQRLAVAALLRQPHRKVGFEVNRHESLRELLGLPEALSTLGFGYVYQGELEDHASAATIRAVGDAEPLREPAPRAVASPDELRTRKESAEKTLSAIRRESQDAVWDSYALVLHEADVPERFVPLFGIRRGHGHMLLALLTQYIMRNNLNVGSGWIRADDLLAEFLGEREFVVVALTRLVRQALGIATLTTAEREAFQRGDPAMMQRIIMGMAEAANLRKKE